MINQVFLGKGFYVSLEIVPLFLIGLFLAIDSMAQIAERSKEKGKWK